MSNNTNIEKKNIVEENITKENNMMESKTIDNNFEKNDKEYNEYINIFINSTVHLIDQWTEKEAGNFDSWLQLMQSVMIVIQKNYKKTGIEKAEISIDVVQKLAEYYYNKNKNKLSENSIKVLNLVMSDNGAFLLNGATSFIKRILNSIDTNNDGEISNDECKNFFRKFCCCCPKI